MHHILGHGVFRHLPSPPTGHWHHLRLSRWGCIVFIGWWPYYLSETISALSPTAFSSGHRRHTRLFVVTHPDHWRRPGLYSAWYPGLHGFSNTHSYHQKARVFVCKERRCGLDVTNLCLWVSTYCQMYGFRSLWSTGPTASLGKHRPATVWNTSIYMDLDLLYAGEQVHVKCSEFQNRYLWLYSVTLQDYLIHDCLTLCACVCACMCVCFDACGCPHEVRVFVWLLLRAKPIHEPIPT